ncbi:hypothetical protein KDN32_20620 [Nocardioides sp. J2M5]|uniref:hypothetical protein n=1 Tax=Nocardioides palaemonis TaxID=2829810 RepID=UPI001BA7ED16|nr:hypothetical protein [Nocardioides palaemonis]MBS2940148.1 hypothetical protein [Nocardioides palaemonis]
MLVRHRALALLAVGGLVAAALAPTSATAGAGDHDRAAPAQARADSRWTRVSAAPVDSLSEIAVQRTGDGTLHAVYTLDQGASASYEHAGIDGRGRLVSRGDVLGTWGGLVFNPKLVPTASGGLRLVFSGLQDTNSANFYSQGYAYEALSDTASAVWALQPRALTRTSSAYGGYGTGATQLSDGTPVTASTLNSTMSVRVGAIETTTPATVIAASPDADYTSSSCCRYDTQLVNVGDTVWAAWFANGSTEDTVGTFVQQVWPTPGPVLKAPQSSQGLSAGAADQTVAMVARPGGGAVVAYKVGYPTSDRIALWNVGGGRPTLLKAPGVDQVALSAAPSGRMWLAWFDDDDEVHAARTGETGLRVGGVRSLGSPSRGQSVWKIAVEGSLAQATVLVNEDGADAVWARVVDPGLAVAASPGKVRVDRRVSLKVKVTDAGVGVRGAKVRAGGASCRTNGRGTCRIRLTPRRTGSVKVTATRSGYGAGATTVKVRR